MTRAALALAVVALAVSFYALGAHRSAPAEDSPGWECATQGNHVCGRGTATGDAQILVLMCSLYWHTDSRGAVHVSLSDPAGYDACLRSGGNS